MREKEIRGSLESAAGFVEDAMDDLKEERPREFDLNIWKALESIEYAAFLLSLEDVFPPEGKTRLKREKEQGDADLLANTLDLLRERVKIADLSSDSQNLSRCVWNARRWLLRIQRNSIGRS
jgi:hypothetical protein